jgi:hypothetical protein
VPFTVEHLQDLGIVCIVNDGLVTAEDFEQQVRQSWSLALEHGVRAVLVDNRRMRTTSSLADIFNLPKLYETIGVDALTRIAVIVSVDPKRKENYVFYENICRNRGWDVRLFEDRRLAIDWLRAD